jgi:hypothetical protein
VAQSERVWGMECVWEFDISISLIIITLIENIAFL